MSTLNPSLFKTDHFKYRQWDRKIPSHIISYIERRFKPIRNEKTILIIPRKILQKLDCSIRKELFLVIKDRVIITGFFEDISLYILRNAKSTSHIIFSDDRRSY